MISDKIDFFEQDGRKLFERIWKMSREYRSGYEFEYKRAFKLYYGYVDMSNRDPYRLHPFFNKVFSHIEILHATFCSMLLSESPRFPITVEDQALRGNAEAIEALLDYYAERNEYYDIMSRGFKLELLTGKVLIWPYWDISRKERSINRELKANGFNIGQQQDVVQEETQELKWTSIPPWTVGVESYAPSLKQSRWVIIERPVSLTALQEQMKQGGYKIKFDDIKPRSEYTDVGRQIRQELGYGYGDNDSDMAMVAFCWLQRAGKVVRYMELLDGETILRDDLKKPLIYSRLPLVEFNDITSPHPTEFYNIGEVKHVEQIQHILNDHIGQLMNAQQQQIEQMWFWKSGHGFTDEDLISTGGNRVEVQSSSPFDEIVKMVDSRPLSADAYKLVEWITKMYDDTSGLSDYMMGNMPERKDTAFAVNVLKEQADKRTAVKIKSNEQSLLHLANLSIDVIDEGLGVMPNKQEILSEILGENARYMIWMTPQKMPGKNFFKLKASDIMAGREQAFNELATLFQMTQAVLPNQPEAAKILWEKSNRVKADEIKRVFTPAQQAMMPGQSGVDQMTGQPLQPQQQPAPMLPIPQEAA